MQNDSQQPGASPGSAPLGGSGHVKHTPGPWHAATSEHYTCGGDQVEVVLLDSEGMVTDQICSVLLDTDDESKTGWRRQEADARLIAAAPELLDVADAWSKAMFLSGVAAVENSNDPIEAILFRTRAALLKVSGQNNQADR